jgi:hypothetical protein
MQRAINKINDNAGYVNVNINFGTVADTLTQQHSDVIYSNHK